ncbi:type I restriction endonuclease [Halomonas sp. BC04]|uniref:type I restriction endonuclease n=1 Tax=Halomonas sp. BC04 TaxID=1403540 RepID=UPI0004AFB14F|nr:type I restriction endonuclease [Halomonas sp. BC04]
MWDLESVENESDVEQKIIWPLLTEARPSGLGIPQSTILTKVNIRRLIIDKGVHQKSYFPDYLVTSLGYPVVVVEAKHPKESVAEGYRQARLYAAELNAMFPHGVLPTKYVIASNGIDFWYGHADHAEPLQKLSLKEVTLYTPGLAEFIEMLHWSNLEKITSVLAQQQRPTAFFKPRRLVGGKGRQNEEVQSNSFGATVAASISHIFNPETVRDRKSIVNHAYIASQRRTRYVDPIDKVIRAAKPPSELKAKVLEDTSNPKEIIEKLSPDNEELEHKVLLIVGSVGSGKTTFLDHLQYVALPSDIRKSTVWCRINMNNAPVSPLEIYDWLRKMIINSCQESLPDIDFDSLDVIMKLYGSEISKFKKGVGGLYQEGSEVYNVKLAELIQGIQNDHHKNAMSHIRYCCVSRGKLCIIALDNCDKKTRDEQLLMFEAAQWLQKEFRCLVMMPLRDETFDNHRDEPPLDTALKDMVFRIEPPLFQHVLTKRVQLSLMDFGQGGNDQFSLKLSNGIDVKYPKSEQAYYLSSIIKSLFEHDRFARRMIVGLAGRNMRKALEIFLEFCSSGYIGDNEVFKIRQSEGQYVLPFHQVATVIMRMNRRYYDSDSSYVKNLFSTNSEDPIPSYFARFMILKWLRERFNSSGTSGLKGYHPKSEMKKSLVPFGFTPDVIDREMNYLLSGQCIIAEHLRTDSLEEEDLVRLGPAGFVHLDMIANINYLAAVAEDTFFDERIQAERVVHRIRETDSQLHVKTAIMNADEVVTYLENVRSQHFGSHSQLTDENEFDYLSDFSEARATLSRVLESHSDDPWLNADKELPRGSVHQVSVTNVLDYGAFVEFENGLVGLVHVSKYSGLTPSLGAIVEVEINWVDVIQRKMGLRLKSIVEDDAGDRVLGLHGG